MSESPVNRQYLCPALEAQVEYCGWNVRYTNHASIGTIGTNQIQSNNANSPAIESNKLKIVEIHPSKPLTLYCDRDNVVSLLDYSCSKVLFSFPVQELINNSIQFNGGDIEREISYQSSQQTFIHMRMSKRSGSHISNKSSKDNVISQSLENILPKTNNELEELPNIIPQPKMNIKIQAGNIKQLSFIDRFAIESYINNSEINISNNDQHFNQESNIMIVTESTIVFYDYVSEISNILSAIELTKAPTCADFIYYNLCAIGCADGTIRIWDCSKWIIVRTLQVHVRYDMMVIKSIPRKSDSSSKRLHDLTLSTDKVLIRFLSIGNDGTTYIWDGSVTYNILDVDNTPAAKLKDSLGASIQKHQIQYDLETNTLQTCTVEKKIKTWDLTAIKPKVTTIGTPNKKVSQRRSSLSAFIASSTGQNNLTDSNEIQIPCIGTFKTDKSIPPGLSKITGFGILNNPYFSNGTFVTCSKSGSVAIMEGKEQSSNDEESERSSVISTSNEKAMQLKVLHEISIPILLSKYVEKVNQSGSRITISDSVIDILNDNNQTAVKIYCLQVHPMQPHLIVLGTSIGLIMISLPKYPVGSLSASHILWDNHKLIFSENSIKHISIDSNIASVSAQSHSPAISRSPSNAGIINTTSYMMATTGAGNTVNGNNFTYASSATNPSNITSSHPLLQDCSTEFYDDYFPFANNSNNNNNNFIQNNNKISERKSISVSNSISMINCRPSFLVSPSGNFCTLFWKESMIYIIIRVIMDENNTKSHFNKNFVSNSTDDSRRTSKRFNSNSLIEVDRCYNCLEFAWIGLSDYYLIKTSVTLETPIIKNRRASFNIFTKQEKEVKKLFSSELLLKQCFVATETLPNRVINHPFSFDDKSLPSIDQVVDLFSGLILSMNTINSLNPNNNNNNSISALASAVIIPNSMSGLKAMVVEDHSDIDRIVKTYKSQYKHSLLNNNIYHKFYLLMNYSDYQIMIENDQSKNTKNMTNNNNNNKGLKKQVPVVESTSTDQSNEFKENGLIFVSIGPITSSIDMIRWDISNKICSILIKNVINIMQLSYDSSSPELSCRIKLSTLGSVDLSNGIPANLSFTSMNWFENNLYITSNSSVMIINPANNNNYNNEIDTNRKYNNYHNSSVGFGVDYVTIDYSSQ
eukprot:gene13282-17795_t